MTRSRTPSRGLLRARFRTGLSLVEAVIAMVIVSVMLVAALNAVGAARMGERNMNESRRARTLAQDLLNEILAQPYAGTGDTPTNFGRNTGESAASRQDFNDVNDYLAWWEQPPLNKDGTTVAGYDNSWRREVSLRFLNPTNVSAVSPSDQGLAEVTVIVKRNNMQRASITAMRSSGLPATQMCTLPDGSKHNLVPAHCLALGGTPQGVGTSAWTIAEPPDVVTGVGLVAHWKMNESSGTTAADSKGTNNGTLTNGPTWVAGKYGNALNLDGSNDFVTVAHNATLSQDSTLTLAAWIYCVSIAGEEEYDGIFHKGTTTSNRNYFLQVDYRRLSFGFRDTGGTTRRFTAGTINTTNRWYHVAATFDDASNTVKLYIDGSLVSTQSTTRTPQTNSGALTLGNSPYGDYLSGRIDDARIYSRVLSAAEITTLFNGGEP